MLHVPQFAELWTSGATTKIKYNPYLPSVLNLENKTYTTKKILGKYLV